MEAIAIVAYVIQHSALEHILSEDGCLLRWDRNLNFSLIS